MNLSQAEDAIYSKLGAFNHKDVVVRYENQKESGTPFQPLKKDTWCYASILYGNSQIVAVGNGPCKRDYGIISIYCYAPKNAGTKTMTALCDAWTEYLETFSFDHVQVRIVHAPQSYPSDDFYAKIIRAEFEIN